MLLSLIVALFLLFLLLLVSSFCDFLELCDISGSISFVGFSMQYLPRGQLEIYPAY